MEQVEKAGVQHTPDQMMAKLERWVRTLNWFGERMLDKMLKNKHKRGWHEDSIAFLRFRLQRELDELDEAIENKASPNEIIDECADIANFALMIADRAREGAVPCLPT